MSVASKNLFALLGNDVEGDSDSPAAPVKTVDKTSTHTIKRNADGNAPSKGPITSGSRRGGAVSGNEAAFRDRNAGHDRNRGKPTDEARGSAARGGYGARGRGNRGGRYPRTQDDRHSKTGITDTEKAASQGWGANEGDAELKDEQAGEEIAKTEKQADEAAEGDRAEEEEEEKRITLDQYFAQQAEKKLALESGPGLSIRKANEGVKEDKKWGAVKELVKDDDEDYFAGTGGKAKRERERKVKQLVEIDNRYIEPERSARGGRGGRGGSRGDGARGRGRGAPRGDFRGGRGGPPRNENRQAAPVNPSDESAFPSLGK